MNTSNNKKPAKKNSGLVPLMVVLAIALSAAGELNEPAVLAAFVGLVVIGAIIAITVGAAKNHAAQTKRDAGPAARPGSPRPAVRARTEAEEAIHCQHKTGRQKYLDQLDSFLANGIIDKAEYRLLRERYSKLNIDEDYHG